ncbi:MAG: HAMP domain-containing histidine kinase [Hahellaceae bacterium]|nr:HAMP domain-containing histidine kinase [Hahellaceae bacterium]
MPLKSNDSNARLLQKLRFRIDNSLRLRFDPATEREFQDYHYAKLKQRIPAIGWSALVIFIFYALFDLWALDANLSSVSVVLRLLLVCPLILGIIWAMKRTWPYARFMRLYSISFLIASVSVGVVIFAAQVMKLFLPYQGLLLLLLFGYFLMLMPTRLVTPLALGISLIYLAIASLLSNDPLSFSYQCVFFATANAMGIVGSFVQEKNLRNSFLTERQLETSRQKLLEESARKTLLLASTSHDLKQPLLALSLLLDDLDSHATPSQLNATVQKLRASSQHLVQLTDSLLDASQLDAGLIQPKIGPVDLRELAHAIQQEYAGTLRQKSIQLKLAIPRHLKVDGDPLLLSRIIRNLVDNAIKHAYPKTLTLSTELLAQRILLCICDDGRGIAATDQAAIFSPFVRLNSKSDGLGLGLSIVRQLCDLLSIPLTLESSPSQGTCFRLSLPPHNADAPAPPSFVVHLEALQTFDLKPLQNLLNQWQITHQSGDGPESELAGDANAYIWIGTPAIAQSRLYRGHAHADSQPPKPVLLLTPPDEASGDLVLPSFVQTLTLPVKPAKLRLAVESMRSQAEKSL